jgi:poly-gamma-glutamate capsule biosynthesis protein CapA/YwtB (metallophosphatase superfamily)
MATIEDRAGSGTMNEAVLALGGDVMLGRGLQRRLLDHDPAWPWDDLLPDLWKVDGFFVNLECALTRHMVQWRGAGGKPFYFRADPSAVEALRQARVDLVSLANNHVGDFGSAGLLETLETLDAAGIRHAGAGRNLEEARSHALVRLDHLRVAVVAAADHPPEWAATPTSPGLFHVAIAGDEAFALVEESLAAARLAADLVVFSIHWGPNMRERPTEAFRRYARRVIEAGADLFWGHSAHIVQGIELIDGRPVLYDTGDLVDDYAVDESLRNDLSALFLVRFDATGVRRIDLLPVRITDGQARRAMGADRDRFEERMRALCEELGTAVTSRAGTDLLKVQVMPEVVRR